MIWRFLTVIAVILLGLSGCSEVLPTQVGPTPEQGYASYFNVSDAVVMAFLSEFPRSIIIDHEIEGSTQVWFDETPDDVGFIVKTQFYSSDGCPLPGPPILPGDPVKITGHLDAESRLVADVLWILNNEVGDENCFGPPADSPDIVVP